MSQSAGVGQHYSLRWNNHQCHVLNAIDCLLQNGSLVDCTLVCEDSSIRAHKVILSACSPYFQKIFNDNPSKHPIIVLKDVCGWEIQCIMDFMYKGETSVPESQLTSLIKAAESLRIRGLTSSSHHLLSMVGGVVDEVNRSVLIANSSSSTRSSDFHGLLMPPHSSSPEYDIANDCGSEMHDDQCMPISLTNHDEIRPCDRHEPPASPGLVSGPRRKQARPRRRSGDSIGNSSLEYCKADSSPSSTHESMFMVSKDTEDLTPENLSMKRSPSPCPAINLVKTERLLELHRDRSIGLISGCSDMGDNNSDGSDRDSGSATSMGSAGAGSDHLGKTSNLLKNFHHDHSAVSLANGPARFITSGLHRQHHMHHEQEARVEALQALNYMATGGGLPPHYSPSLPNHLSVLPPMAGLTPSPPVTSLTSLGVRPNSTPNPFSGSRASSSKAQHSAPRGGPPRSWTNDELTKALENVWNKRMTTSQASRIYGIPYNSLLMYVRGKYGKSLKLDELKLLTPAANDNLNTIGNSRSTPKEKMASAKCPPQVAETSCSSVDISAFAPVDSGIISPFMPPSDQFGGLLGGMLPPADSRIKEIMQRLHNQQAVLCQQQGEPFKEEGSSLINRELLSIPSGSPPRFSTPESLSYASMLDAKNEDKDEDTAPDKERQVQAILMLATQQKMFQVAAAAAAQAAAACKNRELEEEEEEDDDDDRMVIDDTGGSTAGSNGDFNSLVMKPDCVIVEDGTCIPINGIVDP